MKISPLICILGPEGAGKSTTVAALYSQLEQEHRKVYTIFLGRGKENILPLHLFRKKRAEDQKKSFHPQKKPSLSKKIFYTSLLGIYTLDLMLRYLFKVLPKQLNGTIIISDRYSSDLYLMENVPLIFRRMAVSLFPKPALTFFLHNSIPILHQRKGRDAGNLQWQLEQFKYITKKYRALPVRTNDKIETVLFCRKNMEPLLH